MIVLKNEETGSFIYFDVVTQYSRGFTSQVSQHPVDGSGNVSDHVITQNPKFQIVGNITGADFNSGKPELSSEERSFINIQQLVVQTDIASIVELSYDDNPLNLAPDVIGQFFSDTLPTINNLNEGRDPFYNESILFDILKEFQRKKQKLSLYEFDDDEIVGSPLTNMFIVNLKVNETATTGDAFGFDITLEQINISELLEEEIPEDVQQDFRKKNAEKEKKGQKSTSESDENSIIDGTTESALSFLGLDEGLASFFNFGG